MLWIHQSVAEIQFEHLKLSSEIQKFLQSRFSQFASQKFRCVCLLRSSPRTKRGLESDGTIRAIRGANEDDQEEAVLSSHDTRDSRVEQNQ